MRVQNEHGVEVYPGYCFEGSATDTEARAIEGLDRARDEIAKLFEGLPGTASEIQADKLIFIMDSLNNVRNFVDREVKDGIMTAQEKTTGNKADERWVNATREALAKGLCGAEADQYAERIIADRDHTGIARTPAETKLKETV
jgi:hypothetical protein